jgi:two-component system, NarL family, sensor histidine kinase UhpB
MMPVASTTPTAGAQPARARRAIPEEIRITVLYFFFGSLWIVGTDQWLGHVMRDDWLAVLLQSLKGLAFVGVTAFLLFLALRRTFGDRRRAEEALRRGAQRFELTARAATDAIYDWDLATDRLWWSESFDTLFGYAKEEVEPTFEFWTRQLHPEEKESVLKSLREVTEGGGDTWSCEYRFRRKNGSYACVQNRGYLIRDEQRRPIRMIGGMSDITDRKEGQEKLEQSRRQLRALTARLQSSREEERSRISREIHDELGQLLTALKMDLRWLEKKIGERENDPALLPVLEKAVEAGEVADAAITSVQKIASELRPGTLDNLGLAAALRHEAGKFQERTGITCEVNLSEETLDLPRVASTAVFRIFQETLTNVTRHAKATRVRVQLSADGQELLLKVEDNGQGISSQSLASPRSLGLLGMKERAAVLGGEVVVEPAGERGTRVTLRLPRAANDTDFWEHLQV